MGNVQQGYRCNRKLFQAIKTFAMKIVVVKRAMRHKHPVIIIPYYKDTREEEVIDKMLEGFNKDFIKTIHSINEI